MFLYRRESLFSLEGLIKQLVSFTVANGLPTKILLPIEEYFYLQYVNPSPDFNNAQRFIGIPVEINLDKQRLPFSY